MNRQARTYANLDTYLKYKFIKKVLFKKQYFTDIYIIGVLRCSTIF